MGIIVKDDQKFFDELGQAYESGNVARLNQLMKSVQAFNNMPKTLHEKKVQAMSVSSDIAQITKDAFNVIINKDYYDLGWEQAFKVVQLGSNQDSWEIATATNGLMLRKMEEGHRLRVEGVSATKMSVEVDYYGMALGWTDKMIRFRKVSQMIDKAEEMRNKYWSGKANIHYALIAAAISAANTTAYSATGTGRLQRDIATINDAIYTLSNRNKNKGYGDTASIPLVMYANLNDKQRIEAAFQVTSQALATAGDLGDTIDRMVRRIYTLDSNITSGSPIICIPGFKSQKADAMQPTIMTRPQDILDLNYVQSLWAIFVAGIGDTDQFEAITLS